MTPKNSNDKAIQKAHNPGDWVNLYGDYLIQYAYKRTGDLSVSEDLAQDTFMTAWNSRRNFKGNSSFKTWLTAILKHKTYNYYRKHRAEVSMTTAPDFLNQNESKLDDWMMTENSFPAEWRNGPDRAYELKEAYQMFLHCSNSIPSRFIEVFMFAEADGLSGKEISKRLKISQANVWTLLHRAKKALRECMKDFYGLWQST